MDCVPSRAQPVSSGDHPWPQPQYGMEQNHLGHPNSSQQDDIRRYPGPFRKRDLSLWVPPRPPKKKVKLGLVINSSHHGVDRPAGELEEETQDLPENTTLTEAMLAGHEGQTSRTRDRGSNSSYSFVRGPCLPGWAFRGRRLRFLDRSRSPLATLGERPWVFFVAGFLQASGPRVDHERYGWLVGVIADAMPLPLGDECGVALAQAHRLTL
jgi:hypothetical protein